MQGLLDATAGVSLCLTPEAAAKEDILKNVESSNGAGEHCTFEKHSVAGEHLELAGSCTTGPAKLRLTASGTSGATAQDIVMRTEQLGPTGTSVGVMELRLKSIRKGECKPGDITPPANAR